MGPQKLLLNSFLRTVLGSMPCYLTKACSLLQTTARHFTEASRASVKISCCTACRGTPGLGKHFEPLDAVFSNPHCSSGATGAIFRLGSKVCFLFIATIHKVYYNQLSVCGSWQLGNEILSGHHHTGAVMAPLAMVGLDRHVPTKCLNNIFLNNQLWSGAKSRDVFELAIFHLVQELLPSIWGEPCGYVVMGSSNAVSCCSNTCKSGWGKS